MKNIKIYRVNVGYFKADLKNSEQGIGGSNSYLITAETKENALKIGSKKFLKDYPKESFDSFSLNAKIIKTPTMFQIIKEGIVNL